MGAVQGRQLATTFHMLPNNTYAKYIIIYMNLQLGDEHASNKLKFLPSLSFLFKIIDMIENTLQMLGK